MSEIKVYELTEAVKEVLKNRKSAAYVYGFVKEGKLYFSLEGVALVMKTDLPDTVECLPIPKDLSTLEGYIVGKDGKMKAVLTGDVPLKNKFNRPKWPHDATVPMLVAQYDKVTGNSSTFIPREFMDELEYRTGHHAIVISPQEDGTLSRTGIPTKHRYKGAKCPDFSIAPKLFKELKTLSAKSVAISTEGALVGILESGVILLVMDKYKAQKLKEQKEKAQMETTKPKKIISPAELAAQTQKVAGLTDAQTADLATSKEVKEAVAPTPVVPTPVEVPAVEDVKVDAKGIPQEPTLVPVVTEKVVADTKPTTPSAAPTVAAPVNTPPPDRKLTPAEKEVLAYNNIIKEHGSAKGLVQHMKDTLVDFNKILTYYDRQLKTSVDDAEVKRLLAENKTLKVKADKYDKLKALL